jgi:hypothetical protein
MFFKRFLFTSVAGDITIVSNELQEIVFASSYHVGLERMQWANAKVYFVDFSISFQVAG